MQYINIWKIYIRQKFSAIIGVAYEEIHPVNEYNQRGLPGTFIVNTGLFHSLLAQHQRQAICLPLGLCKKAVRMYNHQVKAVKQSMKPVSARRGIPDKAKRYVPLNTDIQHRTITTYSNSSYYA